MIYRLSPPKLQIDAEVNIPGSKSETNRALVLAALTKGEVRLHRVSPSEDSESLIAALEKLGVATTREEHSLRVRGGSLKPFRGKIDVGHAGTSMRFLTALISFIPGAEVELKGSQRMHERPIGDLVEALRSIGANIKYLDKEGCAPLQITGISPPSRASVSLRGDVSSQFISALMLISPLFIHGLKIRIEGELVSQSYLDMTHSVLSRFGVNLTQESLQNFSLAGVPHAAAVPIEPDASGASYLWGVAALSSGRVRVKVDQFSKQGDAKFPELLSKMGCRVTKGSGWIEVIGSQRLNAINVDMSLMPDTAQTLAVIAAFAEGVTKITGLRTLKGKESDRLLALKTELLKAGIRSEITDSSIEIFGGKPKAARFATYNDHRMAMSFALMAMRVGAVEIEDPNVVSKSFPTFWQELSKLGFKIEEVR